MRSYRSQGIVPPKRHTLMAHGEGYLFEELFGRHGFSGPSSLLYHQHLPESQDRSTAGPDLSPRYRIEHPLRQGHLVATALERTGTMAEGRQWLLGNEQVLLGICLPVANQAVLTVNGSADELLFLHEGRGVCRTQFGTLAIGPGDYLVLPRGTISQLVFEDPMEARVLCIETASMLDSPARYRTRTGQLHEGAPYCERDVHPPVLGPPEEGPATVWLRRGGLVTIIELEHHPFDVLGWDGSLYPYTFNIADYEPLAGRVHVPPPFHQTFEADGVVVCSFVPRQLDWDPEANALPYHHSNLDSDEVLYYVDGTYAARRGVGRGSFTHHVMGLAHGPQPGALEASIGRERRTDEVAVMLDTFAPLLRTELATTILDPAYPSSWSTR